MSIEIKNVYKAYKDKPVLKSVNLDIQTGEFFVLIGSSGCGKTTLLKMINKLNSIDKGDILIDGVSIKKSDTIKLRRQIGYVVQDGGLFPHLTIAQNIAMILKNSGVKKEEYEQRVDDLLELVELPPEEYRELYPSQLSGGQRQRVGVARAFANNPGIILMDEPFSALDPVTRADLQDEIYSLQQKLHKTIVFVTHDMDEAIKLADRICVIQNGRVVQCDTPENVLKSPANDYVENFVGKNKLWGNPEFIKARDIMKLRPYRVTTQRTVIQAMEVMQHNAVDSVLVTDERNRMVGIVWAQDLRRIMPHLREVKLEDVITHDYVSVYEDTSVQKIISTIDYNISGVIPVVSHANELMGYLTKSILLSTLSRQYVSEDERTEHNGVII